MSHIEVILAFVLFIGAIVTIFYLLQPPKNPVIDQDYAQEIYTSILQNASMLYTKEGIKITNSTNGVYSINLSSNIDADENISAITIDGRITDSRISPLNSQIVCINSTKSNGFVILQIAKDFNNTKQLIANCPVENSSYYRIGAVYSTQVMSEKEILAINSSYYTNYDGLKKSLGIAKNKEFSFNVEFSDGYKINSDKIIPDSSQVASINHRSEVLRKDGRLMFANINVKVW